MDELQHRRVSIWQEVFMHGLRSGKSVTEAKQDAEEALTSFNSQFPTQETLIEGEPNL